MRKLYHTFLILGFFSMQSIAWPATSKPAKKDASNGQSQAHQATCTAKPMDFDVLQGNDAKTLAQTLGSVFAEHGLVIKKVGDDLCLSMRGNTNAADLGSLQEDLTGIVNLMETDAFVGLKFNSDYVIHLQHLTAKQVAIAFPHPAPGFNLHAVSSAAGAVSCDGAKPNVACGTYLVLVPSAEVAGKDRARIAQALALQAAGIKHDLESLDQQCVCHAGDSTVAASLQKARKERFLHPDALAVETEKWYAEHTVKLAALNPRDVVVKLGDVFSGQQLQLQWLTKEHAVTVVPACPPKASCAVFAAQALERNALHHRAKEEQAWLKKAEGSGAASQSAGSHPAAAAKQNAQAANNAGSDATSAAKQKKAQTANNSGSDPAPATQTKPQTANNGGGESAPLATGPSQQGGSPGRTVRLYYLRQAKEIAAAINATSPPSNPLVEPLNDDLLLVLPPAPGQEDRFMAIHRAIAMLDLPRPQVSLQVWSYQISGKAVNATGTRRLDQRSQSVQSRFISLRQQVDQINNQLTEALQRGFEAILKDAANNRDKFFDTTFQDYLTQRYKDCVRENHYCLGYQDALDILPPTDSNNSRAAQDPKAAEASLSRLILYLAATRDSQLPRVVQDVIDAMKKQGDPPKTDGKKKPKQKGTSDLAASDKASLCFTNFEKELKLITQRDNLHLLRAALLNFLFNYKWALMYANDFVPYDLESSTRVLDSLLSPISDAFDEDIDAYVANKLRNGPGGGEKNTDFASRGMVAVAALSGTQATVSGTVENYFNITPTLSLNDVLNGSQDTSGGLFKLLEDILKSPQALLVEGLANIASKQTITAEVSRGSTLRITPTTLDTASSATLDVDFDVKDNTAPDTVNSSGAQKDLLDRVAEHHVTDHVRVDSLKLFDISSFTMDLTHPRPPWTIPVVGSVWKGIFGTVPVLGKLLEYPRPPKTEENRSVAIIRAVVVPTAMDMGLSLRFNADRIEDPLTGTTDPISSVAVLGGNVRPFNKKLMRCIADRVGFDGQYLDDSDSCWNNVDLTKTLNDLR